MTEEITKKQFKYQGKSVEELQKLDVREFAKMVGSRNRRNILRNFQKLEDFIKHSKKKIEKGKMPKTHDRDLVMVPQMIGWRIGIHNGKSFVPVQVVGEMLGHKFGEFALTRTRAKHSKAGVGATKGTKHKSKK